MARGLSTVFREEGMRPARWPKAHSYGGDGNPVSRECVAKWAPGAGALLCWESSPGSGHGQTMGLAGHSVPWPQGLHVRIQRSRTGDSPYRGDLRGVVPPRGDSGNKCGSSGGQNVGRGPGISWTEAGAAVDTLRA